MTKRTIVAFLLPFTIMIFLLFTKWSIADVIDGTDGVMYGFPFIYKSPVFYTSMRDQYFIIELFADFLIYFAVIVGVFYFVNKNVIKITIKKVQTRIVQIVATVLICLELLLIVGLEADFKIQRDFEIEIKESGFKFFFMDNGREEFNNYHK